MIVFLVLKWLVMVLWHVFHVNSLITISLIFVCLFDKYTTSYFTFIIKSSSYSMIYKLKTNPILGTAIGFFSFFLFVKNCHYTSHVHLLVYVKNTWLNEDLNLQWANSFFATRRWNNVIFEMIMWNTRCFLWFQLHHDQCMKKFCIINSTSYCFNFGRKILVL